VSADNFQMRVLLYAGCTDEGVAEHNVLFPSQQRCAHVLSPSYVTELVLILVKTNLMHNSFFLYIYFNPLHVSSNLVLIIGRISCISTMSGVCQSV
jgi:hypothetical protein